MTRFMIELGLFFSQGQREAGLADVELVFPSIGRQNPFWANLEPAPGLPPPPPPEGGPHLTRWSSRRAVGAKGPHRHGSPRGACGRAELAGPGGMGRTGCRKSGMVGRARYGGGGGVVVVERSMLKGKSFRVGVLPPGNHVLFEGVLPLKRLGDSSVDR